MTDASELLGRMKASAHGERCDACLFEGQVETANSDNSALTRCAGCNRVVCDRHDMQDGHFRDRRHLLQHHAPRHEKRRVVVTEVNP